jgi:hypothetical protein
MPSINDRRIKLIGPFPVWEATEKVHAHAIYLKNKVRVYIPDDPYDKLLPGMEAENKKERTKPGSGKNHVESLIRAIRNAQTNLYNIVEYNDFELFTTFTFKKYRHDQDKCCRTMRDWIKNQKRRVGSFEHLIIPEFHADKQALHFHGLLQGYSGELIDSGKKTKRGQNIYNIKGYRSGFTTAVKINPEEYERVARYVTKYMTKDMPERFGQHRYWRSSGMKSPPEQDNPPDWYLRKKPFNSYRNDYGSILEFTYEELRGELDKDIHEAR